MTAYAGGPQIQNYLDPNRPDYGAILLSGAESTSALEQALMKLNADVEGAELMSNARVKAAKMGAADASRVADAGVFAAGVGAIGQAAGGIIGAIPTGGGNPGGFAGSLDTPGFGMNPHTQNKIGAGGGSVSGFGTYGPNWGFPSIGG